VNYEAKTNAKAERRAGKQSSRRNAPTLSIQPQVVYGPTVSQRAVVQPRRRGLRRCGKPLNERAGCSQRRSGLASSGLAGPAETQARGGQIRYRRR
jgi:hypothetical protein